MAVIKVPTSFNIDLEFEIPEFYRRMFSLFIDMLIEFFYLWIAIRVFEEIASSMSGYNDDAGHNLWALSLLLFLPVMVYHLVLEITMNGQSLGKKIMALRVVNENGGRPSVSQFIIRWLLRISDVWIVLLFFIMISEPDFGRNFETTFIILAAFAFFITDILLVVITPKSQRLGDILAKTILIRTGAKGSIEDTVFMPVADNYKPVFPQIMQLSDRDINAIKSILASARKRGDYRIAETAEQKIKSHLNIESHLSPVEFLEVLLKDYNYLSGK
jgi:uncharacterized RDD family membrane protein YckC